MRRRYGGQMAKMDPRPLSALGLTATGGRDVAVTGVALDSREVVRGALFAALPGTRVHGAEFIVYALRMGAGAILTDRAAANRAATQVEATVQPSMFSLLKNPVCIGFFFCRLLTDPITYFFSFWLPDYLQTSRGFSLAMIGMIGWLPFLASDVGGPGGGALSDWLIRRGWQSGKARLTLMIFAASLMPLASLAVRTPSPWLALGLIALLLGAQSCWMANQLTLISESIPHRQAATLLALSAIGGSVGGMISTLLAGRFIEATGYVPVFTVLGFAHMIALLILFVSLRSKNSSRADAGKEIVTPSPDTPASPNPRLAE